MIQVFKCPSCGATLSYEGGDETSVSCQFCGSTVIVPEELRAKPSPTRSTPAASSNDAATEIPLDQLVKIKELVAAGDKIQAIKVLREATGLGLKEAKDGVEALERGEPLVLSSTTTTTSSARAGFPGLSQISRFSEVIKLARDGQTDEAIQRYREIMNVDVATARSVVEAMAGGHDVAMTMGGVSTGSASSLDEAAKLVQIQQLAKAGQKIEAIKLFRETYDVGLQEAKNAVESMEAGNSPDLAVQRARLKATARAQTSARPRARSSGCAGVFWMIFGLGMAGFVIAMVVGVPFRMSGSYKQAVAAAQADPQVIEALGSPVKETWWPITGELSCGGSSCSANYSTTLSGPKGSARLVIQSDSHDGSLFFNEGTWELSATLITDKNGSFRLTEPPPPTPTVPAALLEATEAMSIRATAEAEATQAAEIEVTEQAKLDATATAEAEVIAEAQATAQAQAAIEAIQAAQTTWPVIISDTFKNNTTAWPTGINQDNSLGIDATIAKGLYTWKVTVRSGNSYLNMIPTDAPLFDNFYAAVDVDLSQAGDNAAYGLVFRHIKDDYGFFGLMPQGSFRGLTVFGSGIYQTIQISSEFIQPGVNRIAVGANGSDFVCLINGEVVYVIHEDFVPGDIGLGTDTLVKGPASQVIFDNFEIRAPQ